MLRRYETGPGHTGPVCFSYIGAMTPAILFLLLVQAPQAASAPRPFAYRGFAPGMPYREFASRARAGQQAETDIICQKTVHNIAQRLASNRRNAINLLFPFVQVRERKENHAKT